MNRSFFLAAASACAITSLSAQGATVTGISTLPDGVNINLTDDEATVSGSGGGVQARWRGGTDLRGAVQTVTWNTSNALDGFGLLFDDAQNVVDPFDADQDFILDIQLLTDPDGGDNPDRVVSTVATSSFTIEPGDVSPSSTGSFSYLFIDLDTDVALVDGEDYAFHLYPDSDPSNIENQRLYFAETGPGDYNAGFGRQTDGLMRAPGQDFPQPGGGFEGTDIAIFTVAVPEPSSLALVAAGGLVMLRRQRSRA